MIEEFEKLLRLKFDERNQNMIKTFTQEKQQYNARNGKQVRVERPPTINGIPEDEEIPF
jgi:hypothetical protein